MTGTHALEASDRAILNLLYQHAHDSGNLLEPSAEWEIPLATVRQAFSKHESSDRLRDSLTRLMSVKVNVAYVADDATSSDGPEQRVVITGLFDFFDVSAKELAKRLIDSENCLVSPPEPTRGAIISSERYWTRQYWK
jgi:hypothetical protein